MRGALYTAAKHQLLGIIIPADAGSTTGPCASTTPTRDHPRGCGEHSWFLRSIGCSLGSSPRMRGAQLARLCLSLLVGIIPADAGSTSDSAPSDASPRDHPRGCGEHSLSRPAAGMWAGSSPRMRGAPGTLRDSQRPLRIIPADAGSTAISPSGIPCPKDHPRGCGEHGLFHI